MKINLSRQSLFILMAASAAMLCGQTPRIDLYLKPDVHSKHLGSVTLQNPQLGQATPVMDEAKAALGWHFADYSGMVDGYVQDAKIGKDLLPVDNALIYAEPSEDSTVLGTYRKDNKVKIVDTGTWWHIEYGGSIPVYFVLDTPPPLPPVTGVAVEEPKPVTPVNPVINEAVTIEDTTPTVQSGNVPLPEKDQLTRPGVLGQGYEGTFRQSKRFLGLFKPKAAYYLEAADGSRMAWIDTEEIVLPGSMKAFIDQKVIIHGERTQMEPSRDWIIHARNMRLK